MGQCRGFLLVSCDTDLVLEDLVDAGVTLVVEGVDVPVLRWFVIAPASIAKVRVRDSIESEYPFELGKVLRIFELEDRIVLPGQEELVRDSNPQYWL
jgi:hypothetical protein